ncbi:50S ribosomal protein L11 methyltransferase [Chryseolinea sp. T2]|uniref:50S ribosomal protein L11 methyltransferase n=1 Tax=Chryseolinea sp. T2 TaxID=3129255 RepID=UPI0030771763
MNAFSNDLGSLRDPNASIENTMYYSCLKVVCQPEFNELLIAEMSEAGFDSFMENDDGFEAYTEGDAYDRDAVEAILSKYASQTELSYSFDRIEKQNWNEQWEKSYEPIVVDDRCIIRAEFHQPDKQYEYDLIITPKMSFGTGHHQTTHLMISAQMKMNHRGRRVMDAGCGTAILSIMASKLGAREVDAFDIDEWSVTNSFDNIELNHCTNIRHYLGKLADLSFDGTFDIILANINKNVLLDEIPLYAKYLGKGSELLLSGFYTEDIPDLLAVAAPFGLKETSRGEREKWASLLLTRS